MQETALLGEVRHYSRYVNNTTTSATPQSPPLYSITENDISVENRPMFSVGIVDIQFATDLHSEGGMRLARFQALFITPNTSGVLFGSGVVG
jgi:hypothetical protein